MVSQRNKPCPFCGNYDLRLVKAPVGNPAWDRLECVRCTASALACDWNKRFGELNPSLEEAPNSGDGGYLP